MHARNQSSAIAVQRVSQAALAELLMGTSDHAAPWVRVK